MTENCKVITADNFEELVLRADRPVLVDFWASWCGPCRMVSPLIDEIADEYTGKAVVGKINIDEQIELAQRYRVMTIPTVAVFKNGEMVEAKVGAYPKEVFIELIDNNL